MVVWRLGGTTPYVDLIVCYSGDHCHFHHCTHAEIDDRLSLGRVGTLEHCLLTALEAITKRMAAIQKGNGEEGRVKVGKGKRAFLRIRVSKLRLAKQ